MDESSATNEAKTSESEVNQTQATVVTERKRGRPRKVDKSKNFHTTANGHGKATSGTLSPSQTEILKTADNSEGRKLDNASSDNTVTPRRASTRVRTPRKNINMYDDAAENKRKRKGMKRKGSSQTSANKNTRKKRGRKPKIATDENVMDDNVENVDNEDDDDEDGDGQDDDNGDDDDSRKKEAGTT